MAKMHENEVETDESLVRHLLKNQFPQWADLPIKRLQSAGTDNAMYRLGYDMTVRLPKIDWAVETVEREQKYLPILAPHLPLEIPTPLGMGKPDEGYPWHWSIFKWIEGENATLDRIADPNQAAQDIINFIQALQKIDTSAGSELCNVGRGVPLANRDEQTRNAISQLEGMIDTDLATKAWEASLNAPVWDKESVWLHGDIQSGNLLQQNGRITAVIDFGCLTVGDPACELQVAWNLFSAETRQFFRDAIQVDDATWIRGRGWALSCGVIALPYYHKTNPVLAGIARYAINEILGDYEQNN